MTPETSCQTIWTHLPSFHQEVVIERMCSGSDFRTVRGATLWNW